MIFVYLKEKVVMVFCKIFQFGKNIHDLTMITEFIYR